MWSRYDYCLSLVLLYYYENKHCVYECKVAQTFRNAIKRYLRKVAVAASKHTKNVWFLKFLFIEICNNYNKGNNWMHMFTQDLPSTMTSACHLLCLYLGQPFIFSPIVSFWPSTLLCLYFLPYIWFASCRNFYLCYYVALDWLFRCFDLACAFLLLCITPDFSLPCSLFSAFVFAMPLVSSSASRLVFP